MVEEEGDYEKSRSKGQSCKDEQERLMSKEESLVNGVKMVIGFRNLEVTITL